MTGRDTPRREQAQAVFFSLIMVVSMIAIGGVAFAGSAAAQDSDPTVTIAEGDAISISGDTLENAGAIDDQTNVSEYREIFDSNPNRAFEPVVDQGLVVNISSQDGNVAAGGYDNFYPYITVEFTQPVTASNGDGSEIAYAQLYYLGNSQESVGSDYGSIYEEGEDTWQTLFFTEDGSPTDSVGAAETIQPEVGMALRDGIVAFVDEYDAEVESLSLGISSPAQAETVEDVVVGDATIDLNELESSETPVQIGSDYYTSIQSAVDDADPDDTIEVEPGTYNESVSITTSNVTLEGPNPGVDGNSSNRGAEAVITQGVKIDDADDVTLDGFTVEKDVANNNNVVRVGENLGSNDDRTFVKDITVENNIITATAVADDTKSAGVGVEAAPNLTVQNNLINQMGTTADPTGGDQYFAGVVTIKSEINNLDISQNTIETGRGVYTSAGYDSSNDVTGNISNNNFNMGSDSKIGVYVGYNSDVTIDENDFNMGSDSPFGVYVNNKADATIDENDFNTVDDISGHTLIDVSSENTEQTIKNNEFNDNTATAVNAGSETVNATSNWWGSADGPSGQGTGNGASVSENVDFEPFYLNPDRTVLSNESELSVGTLESQQDFAGIVADDENITVTASGIAADGYTLKNGTVNISVVRKEGSYVTASNVTVDDGSAEVDFPLSANGTGDVQGFPADTELGTAVIVIEQASDNSDADTGTIELVHEAFNLDEGYTVTSVPQPAELHAQNIDGATQWDAEAGSYSTDQIDPDGDFSDPTDLHRGLYVHGQNDDARLGYEFETDNDQLQPGVITLQDGGSWNLVSSNFDISAQSDEEVLSDLTIDGDQGHFIIDGKQSEEITAGDPIDAYDAYWIQTENPAFKERGTIVPEYDPEDRADVLSP